jgi:ABC-2 type transport system permease protein
MYRAVARLAFQRQLSYRTANLAGLLTNLFFGLLRASVLIALFGARPSVAGYTVRDAITFTGLTQALMSFVAIFGTWELINSIRTGEIAVELVRPTDLFWYSAAQDAGRALGQALFRGLPILALYALAYRITLPTSLGQVAALLVALLLAWFLSQAWRYAVGVTAFWTHDALGVGRLGSTLATFGAGFIMPLAFFPAWAQRLLNLTPFPGMITVPVEIYLGHLTGPALWQSLALQVFWCLALTALARVLLAAGVRQLVIHGG